MALTSGTKLGPYEIQAPLGAGGMGEVYRARDTRLERIVAIKILPAAFASDAERLMRFQQEARVLSALNHPSLLAIFDVGNQNSAYYLVCELLEGETLRERLNAGPLSLRKAVDYGIQMANGLAAAHEKGIVHRDLKPDNIFLTKDGRVKILDFSLAKSTSSASEHTATIPSPATVPGAVMGTMGYMSPEQVRGATVDSRSDIFSFGTVLYEMLSGKRAFTGASSVETMNAILTTEPPELDIATTRIPAGLERIVRHCMEKNPAERFFSAEAVREALAANSVGSGSSAVGRQEAEPLPSIAVLPFLFLSEVEDRQALSLGFADALITTLGSLEDIAVLPTAAIVNCASGIDPARSCRELGVRHILQGSVQKQGDHWRVSTQLFDSRAQKIAYSEKHDFVMENVFEMQDEIGRKVVESLQSRLPGRCGSPAKATAATRKPTPSSWPVYMEVTAILEKICKARPNICRGPYRSIRNSLWRGRGWQCSAVYFISTASSRAQTRPRP